MQFLKGFLNSEGTLTRIQFFYRCLFLFFAYWAMIPFISKLLNRFDLWIFTNTFLIVLSAWNLIFLWFIYLFFNIARKRLNDIGKSSFLYKSHTFYLIASVIVFLSIALVVFPRIVVAVVYTNLFSILAIFSMIGYWLCLIYFISFLYLLFAKSKQIKIWTNM